MKDIRDEIFKKVKNKRYTAGIYTDQDGVISGIEGALKAAEEIGLEVEYSVKEGEEVYAGDLLMQVAGGAKQITMAEDRIIASLSKYSGVATSARAFKREAAGDAVIVGGAWKKMPEEIKMKLKHAATAGGASIHMMDEPMVYLDKNYVEMLGGIQKTLLAVSGLRDRKK